MQFFRVGKRCIATSMFVCLSVCSAYLQNNASNLFQVLCALPTAVVESSRGGIPICHVLAVLWMSYLRILARNRQRKTCTQTERPGAAPDRSGSDVYDCLLAQALILCNDQVALHGVESNWSVHCATPVAYYTLAFCWRSKLKNEVTIDRAKWRHGVYGHDTIAILWV